MTKQSCFALWGGMFILCAGLGFIPEPTGFLRFLLIVLSILFFLPPAALLYRAAKQKDAAVFQLIGNLATASLALTVVTIIANFLTFMAPVAVGNILYAMLVIISAPMFCSQYWVLSLFGWSCLWIVSMTQLRKMK